MTMIGTPEDHTHTDMIPGLAMVTALSKVLMRDDSTLKDKVLSELQAMKERASGSAVDEIDSAINVVLGWQL